MWSTHDNSIEYYIVLLSSLSIQWWTHTVHVRANILLRRENKKENNEYVFQFNFHSYFIHTQTSL